MIPRSGYNYFLNLRSIHPEINPNGACLGHAFQAAKGLACLEFQKFIDRVDSIDCGIPHPQNESKIIKKEDLVRISKAYGLEKEVEKILLERKKPKEVKESKEKPEKTINLNDKLNELVKSKEFVAALKAHGVKNTDITFTPSDNSDGETDLSSFDTESDTENTRSPIPGKRLAELLNYAWALREAFIAQAWEIQEKTSIYEATRVIKNDRSKRRKTSSFSKEKVYELTREKIFNDADSGLSLFYKHYPFIKELCDMQIYISGLAVHQDPYNFPLFSDKGRGNYAYIDDATPLLSPTDLDFTARASSGSSKKSPGFIKLLHTEKNYKLHEVQKKFDKLARAIKESKIQSSAPLPFGIVLTCNRHVYTIGYHSEKNKWLMIDINNLPYREIDESNIGIEITKHFHLNPQFRYSAHFGKYHALLCYEKHNKEWVCLESNLGNTTPKNENAKIIATFRDFLKPTLHYLNMYVYTSETAKAEMLAIFSHAWGDRSLRVGFFSQSRSAEENAQAKLVQQKTSMSL